MRFQGNSEEMIDPNRTFVTSDHHFCDWKNAPFHESTEEEEAQHIALWNSVVGKDDLVLYVGDFCDGGVLGLEYLSHKLNGRKILIKGNHDDLDDDWYRQVFKDVVTEMRIDALNIAKVIMDNQFDQLNEKIHELGWLALVKEQSLENHELHVQLKLVDPDSEKARVLRKVFGCDILLTTKENARKSQNLKRHYL